MKAGLKSNLTKELVTRKIRVSGSIKKAPGALRLRTPSLDASPDKKPLLKGVFSGFS